MHLGLGLGRPRLSTRSRAAAIALACVIAGASGVAGAAVMIPDGDEPQSSSTAQSSESSDVLPEVLEAANADDAEVEANAHVRREAVGAAKSYPGSIAKAPEVALEAYQRAGAVMNSASKCQLDWSVLAAIGRVESNHSRGAKLEHKLGKAGVAKPAIVGHVLNGRRGLGTFADTDAGALDRNEQWDAPVGALALLPTTWSSVAVDADGDQERNPQDIDDAALGAAVFLCADGRKLKKPAQLRKALATYHRAPRFVSTVMALHKRYQKQASKVPDYTPPDGVQIPDDMPDVCDCSDPSQSPGDKKDTTPNQETDTATDGPTRSAGPSGPKGPKDPKDPPTTTNPPTTDPPTECPSPTDPESPTQSPTDPPPTECPTDPPTTDPPTTDPPTGSPTGAGQETTSEPVATG